MKYAVTLLLLTALTGCNRSDNQTQLYDQERKVLEKAKQVDATVQKQAQDLQQSLNKQIGQAASQP